MMRYESGRFGKLLKRAVLCAALFFCAPAFAQEVTLTSDGGGLSIVGRMIGFDGENIQIESEFGPLTLRYDAVTCAGDACPNLETYVPELRLSGARRMADILMPAMVEGFARSKEFAVTFEDTELGFSQTLMDGDQAVARFLFHVTNTDEGFADLIAHETDIVMSVREVRATEVDRARDVGLGRLDDARQSRIVGLDALVPVVSPRSDVGGISLADLSDAFAGETLNWSALGGPDLPMTLHLGSQNDGQMQRFIDDVLGVAGKSLGTTVVRHADDAAVASAIAADPGALGILPFTDVGIAQPIALRDACGFISAPRLTALKTEDYPLTAPMFLYLPSRRLTPLAGEFLAWMRGPQAQLVVRRSGFVDQGAVPIPLDAQGQRFANAIAAAGDDMPLIELQRMVRVLGARVRLSTSFRFEVGSTRRDAQSRSNLLSLAQAIRDGRYDARPLLLAGFSDGRGAASANRDLSSARAEAVLRDLQSLLGGILPDGVSVETEAFGEALPMGCDDTEWGRQMNRRVELWVSQ
jgi:phosphate transport system substrate-binding protein